MAAFNLEAFGEEEVQSTPVLDSKIESYDKPYAYKGKSKHPNFVNINVIYDKRDAKKAAMIRERDKKRAEERERQR